MRSDESLQEVMSFFLMSSAEAAEVGGSRLRCQGAARDNDDDVDGHLQSCLADQASWSLSRMP